MLVPLTLEKVWDHPQDLHTPSLQRERTQWHLKPDPSVFPGVILKIFYNWYTSERTLVLNHLEQDSGAPAVPGFNPLVA